MSEPAFDLLTGAIALAALAGAASLWLRATRPLRRGGAAEHWLDGMLTLSWLAVVLFFALATFHGFRIWIAIAATAASGLAALSIARRRAIEDRESDLPTLAPPEPADPFLWSALPLCGLALVRLLKGMIAPPMAWDAMTVHLPKAAFWIQSGSLALPDFPDAWTYYRWFPAGGEILFSWIMLPLRADLLLAVFGFAVWLAIWVAGARLARVLGAADRNAWLAGAAVAALPAALVFMTANYVDNLAVLFVLLALSHTILFGRGARLRNGVLAVAAAGLAISVKTSAIVLAAPVLVAVTVTGWRHRERMGRWAPAALLGALLMPCAGYLWTWLQTGSPFYPVRAPGLPLPHHQGLSNLFSGKTFAAGGLADPGWQGLVELFRSTGDAPHMNFGLGGALLAGGAAIAVGLALARPGRRAVVLLCLAGAALMLPLVLSPDHLALRTVWVGVLGRHLLPAWAPIALCSALLPGIAGRAVASASVLASILYFLPLGWSASMTAPARDLAGLLVVCALGAVVLSRIPPKLVSPAIRWGLTALIALALLGGWSTIRDRARFAIYRETAPALGAFDAHPIHPAFAMAGSLWPRLDSAEDKRIAVTIGPDRVGHNQFFYPLLGSRLQNRLFYLPTSNDPREVELEARQRYERADPDAWLEHLQSSSPDLVVGLWRATPEREWLASEGSFEVASLTDLGVPWIGRRASSQETASPALGNSP